MKPTEGITQAERREALKFVKAQRLSSRIGDDDAPAKVVAARKVVSAWDHQQYKRGQARHTRMVRAQDAARVVVLTTDSRTSLAVALRRVAQVAAILNGEG